MKSENIKIRKSLLKTTIILVTIAMFSATTFFINTDRTLAQGGEPSPSGTGQEAICRGSRNWAAYGITIWNQFMDPVDFFEYWKDIIYRYWDNFCWYTDIDNLLIQINNARESVRKAFYTCTSSDKIVNNYYLLEAQLYFLRNYVNWQNEQDAEGNKVTRFYFKPLDTSWRNFTNSIYSNDDDKVKLFNQFMTKYTVRLDAYNNCKDPGLETLVYKFNEDMQYLSDTWDRAKKSVSNKAKKLAKTAGDLWDQVKSGEYFTNMLQVRINGMPCPVLGTFIGSEEKKQENKQACKMAYDDIYKAIKANTPAWGMVTQDQYLNALSKVTEQASQIFDDTNVLAKYEMLYYEGSDDMAKEIVQRLNGLNNMIQQTYGPENQTLRCVRSIGNSQCANIMGAGTSY